MDYSLRKIAPSDSQSMNMDVSQASSNHPLSTLAQKIISQFPLSSSSTLDKRSIEPWDNKLELMMSPVPSDGIKMRLPQREQYCWLNAALYYIAANSIFDRYLNTQVADMVQHKLQKRHEICDTRLNKLKGELNSLMQEAYYCMLDVDKFSSARFDALIVTIRDLKDYLKNHTSLKMTFEGFGDVDFWKTADEYIATTDSMQIDENAEKRDFLRTMLLMAISPLAKKQDMEKVLRIATMNEHRNRDRYIEDLLARKSPLQMLQDDFVVAINMMREDLSGDLMDPEVQDDLIDSLQNYLEMTSGNPEDVMSSQFDCHELISLMHQCFDMEENGSMLPLEPVRLSEDVTKINQIVLPGNFTFTDADSIHLHIERLHQHESQPYLVQQPIAIDFNRHGIFQFGEEQLYRIEQAVIFSGMASVSTGSFGHYVFIQMIEDTSGRHYFEHNDSEVREVSEVEYLKLARNAVLLKLKKIGSDSDLLKIPANSKPQPADIIKSDLIKEWQPDVWEEENLDSDSGDYTTSDATDEEFNSRNI